MFKLTKALVAHALKEWDLPEELAADVEANKDAILKHLIGQIASEDSSATIEEVNRLAAVEDEKSGQQILQETLAASNKELLTGLTDVVKTLVGANAGGDGASAAAPPAATTTVTTGEPGAGAKAYAAAAAGTVGSEGGGDSGGARVKSVTERYGMTKRFVAHQTRPIAVPTGEKTAAPRMFDGYSDLDLAIIGVTGKYLARRAGIDDPRVRFTDEDEALFKHAVDAYEWAGPIGAVGDEDNPAGNWAKFARLNPMQKDTVLDEPGTTGSGGIAAVPIVFDDAAVTTPLLMGELLPLVDMRATIRRRVESFFIENPTMAWTVEGTVPPEFDTTDFIGYFNTNVHPHHGWIEIGLDFEADSPVDMGNLILSRYQVRAAHELDNAIATGTGTGMPLGIVNTTGGTAVASDNGNTGPPTVSDYERLMFGVKKEFRQEANGRDVFIANETVYQRARGIEVGTADQRRIYGVQNYENFQINNKSYRINHGIVNTTIAFACMNRYVMYRRLGFDVRRTREGKELVTRNLELLSVRQRYGGQFNNGGGLALMTDAQT